MTDELAADSRTVFVVHGRNEGARRAMFEFLRSIDLRPMEWTEAIALTGKASPYIGEILESAFSHAQAVVILMTPDEIAYLQPRYGNGDGDNETKPAAQARPNVLFEAGMALGRHSDRTVLVELGEIRPFSDVGGRHALRLCDTPASRQALADRLRIAGCPVSLTGTDWHNAGDFTPPEPPGNGLLLGRRVPSNSVPRPAINFNLRFQDGGSGRLSKLAISNRGTETARNVSLSVPEGVAIGLEHTKQPIDKIPGNGATVTVYVDYLGRYFGNDELKDAFDVTLSATAESGDAFTQEVFLDTNG